jgi:DNA repair exonuclease SbcCD ATPase subunit
MSISRRRDSSTEQQQKLRDATAERLEAIVEAAERAAESVIDDAEAQARRYLSQAHAESEQAAHSRTAELAAIVDSLLNQAVTLRQEAERLQASLEEAQAQLGGAPPAGDEAVVEVAPPEKPRLRAVDGEDEPEPGAAQSRSDATGARLLATQMAVSGSSREEIESRLRERFQIEDTNAILDAILGPGD